MDKTTKKKGKKATKKTTGPKFDVDIDLDNEEPDLPVAAQKEETDEIKPIKIQHVKIERIEHKEQIKTQSAQPASLEEPSKQYHFAVKKQQEEVVVQSQIEKKSSEMEAPTQKIEERREVIQSQTKTPPKIIQSANIQPPSNEQDLLDIYEPIPTKTTAKTKPKKEGTKTKLKKKAEVKPTKEIKFDLDDEFEQDVPIAKSEPIPSEQQKAQVKLQQSDVPLEKAEIFMHRNDQANLAHKIDEDFSKQLIVEQSFIPQKQELNVKQAKEPEYPNYLQEVIPPIQRQQPYRVQIEPSHIPHPLLNIAVQQEQPINQLQLMIAPPKKATKPTKKKKTEKAKENPTSNLFNIDFEQELLKVEKEVQRQTYKQQKKQQSRLISQVIQATNAPIKVQLTQQQPAVIEEKKYIAKESIIEDDHHTFAKSDPSQEKHSKDYAILNHTQHTQEIKREQAKEEQITTKPQQQSSPTIENDDDNQIGTISLLKPEPKKVKKATKGTKKVVKPTNAPKQFAFTFDQAIDEAIHHKEQISSPIKQQKTMQKPKIQQVIQVKRQEKPIYKQPIQDNLSQQPKVNQPVPVMIIDEDAIIEKNDFIVQESHKIDQITEHTHVQRQEQPIAQPIIQQKEEELKLEINLKPNPVQKTSNIKKKVKKEKKEKPITSSNKNIINSDLLLEDQDNSIPFIQQATIQVQKVQEPKQQIRKNEEVLQIQSFGKEQIYEQSNDQYQTNKPVQYSHPYTNVEMENKQYVNDKENYFQTVQEKKTKSPQEAFEQPKPEAITQKQNEAVDEEIIQQQQQVQLVQMKQFSKNAASNNKKVSKKPKTKAKAKIETNSSIAFDQFLNIQQSQTLNINQKTQKVDISPQKIQENTQQRPLIVQTHSNEPIQIEQKPIPIPIIPPTVHIAQPIIQQVIPILQSQLIQHQPQLVQQLKAANQPIKQDLPQSKAVQQQQEDELAIQITLNDPKQYKHAQKSKKQTKKTKPKGKTQIKNTLIIEKANIDEDIMSDIQESENAIVKQVKRQVKEVIAIEKPKVAIAPQAPLIKSSTTSQKIDPNTSRQTEKKEMPSQAVRVQQRVASIPSGEQKKKQIVSELINLIRFHNDSEIRIMRDRMQMLQEDILSRKLRSRELPRKQAKKTDYEWILEENIALKNQQRSLNKI